MVIRLGKGKAFVVQATIYLAALFLSFNLISAQMASCADSMVGNRSGIPPDGWKPIHKENLPPYRVLHDSLGNRVEKEGGDPRLREEYLRNYIQRRKERAKWEGRGNPPSEGVFVGNGVEGAHTAKVAWAIETVDMPKDILFLSSRIIAVDTSNHPHIAYGGDCLYYAYHDGNSWHYETADPSSGVGNNASLALDASGYAHISYHDFSNRNLKYATNKFGSWVTATVDSEGWVGFASSIAIDPSGHVHISYLDEGETLGSDKLKYATNASGAWVVTAVDSEYIGFENSIAVDASGHAHISYEKNPGLRYATNASGTWITVTLDSDSNAGTWNSIAVDASGHPHIGYSDRTNKGLKYVTNKSGAWVTTTVDSGEDAYLATSLALDTAGGVHISYGIVGDNIAIKYAAKVSGSWVITTVNSNEAPYGPTSLALDTTGHAHVVYFSETFDELKYAVNVSGAWVTLVVDQSKSAGRNSSLALDAFGHAHISYLEFYGLPQHFDLKYTTNITGSWVTTVVDNSGAAWGNTSIALDAFGHAHISYRDWLKNDLKYATNISGAWATTTVDSNEYVGIFGTSIALDSKGMAHISYLAAYNTSLMYATNASGAWVTTMVDNSGDVGYDSSLELDSKGKVHISYNDEWNSDLRYATNQSGRWVTQAVATDGYVGWYTSLDLDASDKAHISHFDVEKGDLKYTTNIGGQWKTTTIDSLVGAISSLALNKTGRVYVSYQDFSLGDLKYASGIHIPTAKTMPATKIRGTAARLNAKVNANHLPTDVWFEWGTDRGGPYDYTSSKKTFNGGANEKYSYMARNLTKEITYYYRVVAENEDGITYGGEESFETKRK